MTITRTHLAGLELALNRLALSGSDYLDLKDLIAQAQAAPGAEPVAFVHPSYLGPGMETWAFEASRTRLSQLQVPLYTAPQHDAGWREHSKQYAKGEKCPETIETLQAAWDRDQELMMDQKAEISRLKEKLNRAEQRNKPHDAELVELLAAMRSFTLEHDSGIAGVLRGKIDAKLATLKVKP